MRKTAPHPQLLYFSLEPDGDVRDDIAAISAGLVAQQDGMGKPVARNRLHLTLYGLAELESIPATLRRLALRAGDSVVARPFDLCLDRVSAYAGGHIVLVPTRVPPPLLRLHRAINRALADHGLTLKSRLQPHVTLFREGRPMPIQSLPAPVYWLVDSFSLIHTFPTGKRTGLRDWRLNPL